MEQIEKAAILVRNSIIWRSVEAFPLRLWRDLKLAMRRAIPLQYQKLQPRWDLMEKYPHVSDDDAFVNMDAHAAITYLLGKGYEVPSHANPLSRLTCRGEGIVVRKPLK